ncbi:hypothetical protein EVJ86_34050 [Pseudomonas aeruginosa]|nr:hypothetical protein EVJ86_34050 [Pseudomonas aeruginosa]
MSSFRSPIKGYTHVRSDFSIKREYRKFKRPFRAVCGVAGGGTRVGLGVSWALSRGLWAG